jgi:phage gpG-like protein
MISVTITGIERVQSVMAKLHGINRLVEQWMKSGKPDQIMQKSFLDNFKREGRPVWAELSEETILDRDYKGYDEGPILQRSGDLMDAVTAMKGKVSSTIGFSQMVWGIDQLGASVRKKFGPNQVGKGRSGQNLPARPMIGFQKSDGKVLVMDLGSWIIKSIA